MIEFIDETSEKEGTAISRKTMMAIQGFITNKTTFNEDGSIVQENGDGHTLTTTFNDDGSITQVLKGEKTITKKTIFNADGSVSEVIS